jgi:hypothetical protein
MQTETRYYSEEKALRVLMNVGDYSEGQAKIILGHSLKRNGPTGVEYPADYIVKRSMGVTG